MIIMARCTNYISKHNINMIMNMRVTHVYVSKHL